MADDPALLEAAKESIGRTHGLNAVQSARLVGASAQELHADAKAMARELNVYDPTERARDDGGKFRTVGDAVGADMNTMIRRASGRR
jgi:hypothetical protein